MESAHEVIAQIDGLFHSRSIAIVGVPRGMKTGKIFLLALLDQGFSGRIYPVNPRAQTIDGLKAYPRIADIPGPVDLAIILVPSQHALAAIRECAAKGIKGAVLFTAGFSETGTPEGADLEAALVRTARAAGMRLIGPNGMGLYCPETGLSFFPQASRQPGPIGMISHSGSLTNILGVIAEQKGFRFSKVISSGNECDLTAADFLTYLAHDPATEVIGAYIEGIKNGPDFLQALKHANSKKPVIIWKVGLTTAGARAAASHTGALAGAPGIWEGVLQQTGAIAVAGFEKMVDTLMGFAMFPQTLGNRMAIVSGPGGLAVSAAEACERQGLELAALLPETSAALARYIQFSGTSLRNPIDVSLTAHFDLEIFFQAARTLAKDPGVDALIVIGCGMSPESNQIYAEGMLEVLRECKKSILAVRIHGFDQKYGRLLCQGGIPFFDSAERAVDAYARAWRYWNWRKTHSKKTEGK